MSSPQRSHARTRRPREEGIGRVERIEFTLEGLRELRRRIDEQRLEPGDWPLLDALVGKQIGRIEGRLERMMAKLAAETAAAAEDVENTDDASESVRGVEHSVHDDDSENHPAPSDANTANDVEPAARSAGGNNAQDKRAPEKRKGHGRNGVHAYRKAKHFFYALGVGVLGAVCNRCGFGKMYRYREKVIIRIVGQPLFSAEIHHYEQARCRYCGLIIRATGPAPICEGVGSDLGCSAKGGHFCSSEVGQSRNTIHSPRSLCLSTQAGLCRTRPQDARPPRWSSARTARSDVALEFPRAAQAGRSSSVARVVAGAAFQQNQGGVCRRSSAGLRAGEANRRGRS